MSYVRTPEIREKNAAANRGQKRSPETRARISAVVKGRVVSEDTREKISRGNKGHIKSPEARAKLSATLKGHPISDKVRLILSTCHIGVKPSSESNMKRSLNLRGEKNPNWRGGITPKNSLIRWNKEYGRWRTAVFIRDDYTCQKRGAHSKASHTVTLAAHHMDCFADFPEKRLDVNNGITLCKTCHDEFHDRYGKLHNRKWQTDEFVSDGIEGD